jgi:hypothetical protein
MAKGGGLEIGATKRGKGMTRFESADERICSSGESSSRLAHITLRELIRLRQAHEHADAPHALGRCARVASGHATAAPLRRVMNLRRLIIRSPRRRGR